MPRLPPEPGRYTSLRLPATPRTPAALTIACALGRASAFEFAGALALIGALCLVPVFSAEQGAYFAKKKYDPTPLPHFDETKEKLPAPIFDENPACVDCYWKAWELAFKNFHEPNPGSGYVSQFIDAAFNQNIFLWDTAFMTFFCNYGHPHVPGIASLDNFYAKQHRSGEICREIDRATGKDFAPWVNAEKEPLFSRWGFELEKGVRKASVAYRGREAPTPDPELTLDALNHPILAWAELESYRITGDRSRLELVWEPLVRYHDALRKYLRQGNGLYMTDWASMDNSPRNAALAGGGTAIDTSCEMALFARNLAEIGRVIGKEKEARDLEREADELSTKINELMWDGDRGFYYDLTPDGRRSGIKTVAAFWALVSGVAGERQAQALVAALEDPRRFKTLHRVSTLAADEAGFSAETGEYWRGSVWAPTDTMVIRGLETRGKEALAREIARNHLDHVVEVFRKTGTIWENYAPQRVSQGRPAKGDFVGWSGLAPIVYLIEYGIGIRVGAPASTVVWRIESPRRVGIERLRFGGKTVSLVCGEPDAEGKRVVLARSDGEFRLTIHWRGSKRELSILAGKELEIRI